MSSFSVVLSLVPSHHFVLLSSLPVSYPQVTMHWNWLLHLCPWQGLINLTYIGGSPIPSFFIFNFTLICPVHYFSFPSIWPPGVVSALKTEVSVDSITCVSAQSYLYLQGMFQKNKSLKIIQLVNACCPV